MTAISTIGFDADDTLWHNERFFRFTQDRFAELLAGHADKTHLLTRLLEAERRNIGHYGFGIKGFTLSMVETAIEVTQGQVPAEIIAQILDAGRDMLSHPVEPLPEVGETLERLAGAYTLVLITKGDLFDQERKLAQSGLDHFFSGVEVVSGKTSDTYARAFATHGNGPRSAVMVGNSLRSDILPALDAGSWGVFVPYEVTFALEHAEEPVDHGRFRRIASLGALPPLVEQLAGGD